MSRRRNPGDPRRAQRSGEPPPSGRGAAPLSTLAQLGIVVGAFVIGVLAAELFGAANLGVALGVGQITFTVALVAVLLKGS